MSLREPLGALIERTMAAGIDLRVISVAVGDRYRPLGPSRIFGYIGELTYWTDGRPTWPLHGPWRPTGRLAAIAVLNRADSLNWERHKPKDNA